MKLEIDLEKLTLRDIEDFEEKSGVAIGEVGTGKALPAKALRALVWVSQRRTEPGFTYEDAGDVAIGELDFGTAPNADAGAVDSEPTSLRSARSTA